MSAEILTTWALAANILCGIVSVPALIFLYLIHQSQQSERLETSKALQLQRIDSTFFNMISILNQIVDSVEGVFYTGEAYPTMAPDGSMEAERAFRQYKGRAYLRELASNFTNDDLEQYSFNRISNVFEVPTNFKRPAYKPSQFKLWVADEYEKYVDEHASNLGRYFRYVYTILHYIIRQKEAGELTQAEARNYIDLLQAQLSNDELGLLFYHALSNLGPNKNGRDQFRQWLDEYGVLENLDNTYLFHDSHAAFYPRTRFSFQ